MSGFVYVILVLMLIGLVYVSVTFFYSHVLYQLYNITGYAPPSDFAYLDQLIFGFIYIFILAIAVDYIIKSYRKSRGD